MTEFSIYLFKPISGTELKMIESYSIFDIKGGEAFGDDHFSIKLLDKVLSFYGESVILVLNLISMQLNDMLLPKERPCFKGMPGPQRKPIPYQSLLLRFRGKLKCINRYPPQTFLDELDAYLKTEPVEFCFNKIKEIDNYIDALLEAIEIEPRIYCLRFTGEQKINHWNLLSVFIRNNTTIKKIVISENVNRGFVDFCAALTKNVKSGLTRIDFMNCIFLPEHIEALDKAIRTHHMTSLSFNKCNISKSKNNFLTMLNTNENGINVSAMHFTSMNLSQNEALSSAMFQLSFLSLRGCCLELSTLLSQIKNTRISKIDFSKNRCILPIQNDFTIPPTLVHLSVNDIKWTYKNFSTFFKTVTNSPEEFTLSIAKAELSEEDWISTFDLLGSIKKTNLISLIWRGNPLHYKVCDFIRNSGKIWFLSAAGCHIPSDGCFQKLLLTTPSIKALDIHGTVSGKLGTDSFSIINTLLKVDLMFLDISNNKMGNGCAFALSKLIERSKISELLIDNNDFDGERVIRMFISATNKRKTPIFIKYPHTDFAKSNIPKALNKEIQRSFLALPKRKAAHAAEQEWILLSEQKYETEKDIEVPFDPGFDESEDDYITGTSFWSVTETKGQKKETPVIEKEQMTWDLNVTNIPEIDTTKFATRLANFFSLENNTRRLINTW